MVDRFYDPTTGTFLTRDPITAITRSPYGCVGGNPLNATDPSGLWCTWGVSWGLGTGCEPGDEDQGPRPAVAGRAPGSLQLYGSIVQYATTNVHTQLTVGDWYQGGKPGTVNYTVTHNGTAVDVGSFEWSGTGAGRHRMYECQEGVWEVSATASRPGHGSTYLSGDFATVAVVETCDEDKLRQDECDGGDWDSWWNPRD